ncbi:CRISPR-associated protein, Cse2 family [Gloeothece citriformis PCC 7424]|uniref:CRISPR-associated protein, Cse2 family n=1 Tax=Gloeothece citriformis (strain PCC 7424) TaxID=65393 RepID=B7KJ24_GLOC7|nr:type I-E CRISPR-associated protein Cse2/CasB [Gloeothece citriformis]ACK70860.1 CRISPR-associated protein, Cse2 family [Gloeothece citriformis PCC 7424]
MTTTEISKERAFINAVWQRIEGNRGAIATVSRCTDSDPYYQRQAATYIYPYLPDDIRQWQKKINRYVFVAALMAKNHQQNPKDAQIGSSFGHTCLRLKKHANVNANGIENRFQALLNANGEDVYRYLGMFAPLLRQHNIPCEWAKLLEDLNCWDHEEEKVRLRWARDFYQD